MGLVKQAQQIRCQIGRESLKVVIMSATLQIELFTNFFEVVVVMSTTLQTNYFVVVFVIFIIFIVIAIVIIEFNSC